VPAERPAPLDRVLVIIIIDRGGQKLGQNRAKFDWPLGQSLGGFPHRGVLQIARAERPDNPRQYPRLELIMQYMPGSISALMVMPIMTRKSAASAGKVIR
jgi:hypothetical protein